MSHRTKVKSRSISIVDPFTDPLIWKAFNRRQWRGLLLFLFLFSAVPVATLAQEGQLLGIVTDLEGRPLAGSTLQIGQGTLGGATDADGRVIIEEVPEGTHTYLARFVGYSPARGEVRIVSGEQTVLEIQLRRDLLGMGELVVSGSFNPAVQLESSTSITSLTPSVIEQRIPRGVADLLKAVPGVQSTSNYGEAGNDVTIRGLPVTANSSFRYISLQEDGLPVFEPPGLLFAFPDAMARQDETIARIETVRGGSSAIFTSNTPGGMVNLISKTGGETLQGTIKNSVGLHGMVRQDLNVGGPLGDLWRFNVGGYYRHDEGVRHPGYPANRGGQVKLNVTRQLDRGLIRFYTKYLNEKNVWFMGSPIRNYKEPEAIPGGPAVGSGTSFPRDRRVVSIPDAFNHGSYTKENLDHGYDVSYRMAGMELFHELENDWDVTLRSRFLDSDNRMNLMIDVADPMPIQSFASPALPSQVPRFVRFVNSGETVTNPQSVANLNGNGLMSVHGMAFSDQPVQNFITDVQLSRDLENHSMTLGAYYSTYRTQFQLTQHGVFVEVANRPRLIQVMIPDGSGGVDGLTPADGFAGYNSGYWNLRSYTNLMAFYAGDTWNVNDYLTLDGGVRVDMNHSRGDNERPVVPGEMDNGSVSGQSVPPGYPAFEPTPQQTRAGMFGSGRFRTWDYRFNTWSASLGANVAFTDELAIYSRFSRGNRAPTVQQWTFQTSDGSQVTGDTNRGEIETILQAEAGVKWQSDRVALLLAGFYSRSEDLITTLHRGQADGSFIFLPITGNTRTFGLEMEAAARLLPGLDLRVNSTLQDPRFTKFEYEFFVTGNNPESGLHQRDYAGNYLNDIVRFMTDVTAQYNWQRADLFMNYRYTGSRMANRPNTIRIPGYSEVMGGVGWTANRIRFSAQVTNLFNTQAVAQMANRTGEDVLQVNSDGSADVLVTSGANAGTITTTSYSTGLGILPRSILLAVTYRF